MSERYVVHESDGSRDITFVATGPEVALAIEAAKLLQDRNINVTVVSMSCWNLFDQQPYNHRAETLGNGPQIAIEAAGPFDWERYVGASENAVGVNNLGASASSEELYEQFGLTPEKIVERVRIKLNLPTVATL
ncbi:MULTISPECIES: transketolase C-terminal domain-containing protein [Roseobacteraceae]|uniref:transketolase-like TK C-terminal-containing protein n=1 Tax=Roseobacteraceae TaxID=2854170 RepID=UPI00125F1FE7|nr:MULTISPECIES: transketolase C-terminal domain-containing protein [Roseobacteraceae]KAB6716501.1 hypothetical protein C8029_08795 [Roseobacter sp. TSBP12]|tara:strand:- start:4944 stop:5345 length:402 start_codon:yes stop_codon:yes gene_type:complete